MLAQPLGRLDVSGRELSLLLGSDGSVQLGSGNLQARAVGARGHVTGSFPVINVLQVNSGKTGRRETLATGERHVYDAQRRTAAEMAAPPARTTEYVANGRPRGVAPEGA
ncbi:hypothetical protein PMIN03_008571 [Paraphaeosphaeria minitans]